MWLAWLLTVTLAWFALSAEDSMVTSKTTLYAIHASFTKMSIQPCWSIPPRIIYHITSPILKRVTAHSSRSVLTQCEICWRTGDRWHKVTQQQHKSYTQTQVCILFFLSLQAAAEFVPTVDWLAMVLNTLLSVSSSNYKATGPVFPWFLHVRDNPLF